MVTISRKKRPSRQALWKIRLALYGLSALALLFSVCLVFTDLIQQQAQELVDGRPLLFPTDYHRKLANPDRQDLDGTYSKPETHHLPETLVEEKDRADVLKKLEGTKVEEQSDSQAHRREEEEPANKIAHGAGSSKVVAANPPAPVFNDEHAPNAGQEIPSIPVDTNEQSLRAGTADAVAAKDQVPPRQSQATLEVLSAPLSKAPTMFVLVADSRAASDWIMSRLDLHPAVCASSETGGLNGGEGYPLGCMLPSGMPWLQDSDPRQGCILAFIRPKVKEIIQQSRHNEADSRWDLPLQCQDVYDAQNDPLQFHLKRLCTFAKTVLEHDEYDTSTDEAIDVSITHAYMKAFQEDTQELLACKCPDSTKVRGVKVLTDWIPSIHGFLDRHEGVRVLRLHRRNTFARYLSLQTARKTNIWQTKSAEEKHRQIEALPADWTIDVDDMLESFTEMEGASIEADKWAIDHAHDAGRDVYSFEYEDCRDRPEECFVNIFRYLGIEDSHLVLESNKNNFLSTFKDSMAANLDSLLDRLSNQELVREILSGSNYGDFIGEAKQYSLYSIFSSTHTPRTSIMVNHHRPFVIAA